MFMNQTTGAITKPRTVDVSELVVSYLSLEELLEILEVKALRVIE